MSDLPDALRPDAAVGPGGNEESVEPDAISPEKFALSAGNATTSKVGELRALEANLAVLLADSDTWAALFGSAVRRSGGELVTSGRIPTQALVAAVEADRQAAASEGA